MSDLADAIERVDAYMQSTTRLPPPAITQASFDMGLILGVLRKVMDSQCLPEHDHHVMPHRGCPLR